MYRYIVSVIGINSIGEGKVLPSTGQARFKTSYTAVVFKPFKGEVMDGRVTNVNKVSFPGFVFGASELTTRWASSQWSVLYKSLSRHM